MIYVTFTCFNSKLFGIGKMINRMDIFIFQGYSTASSSASAVLLQQDLTSLPPSNSAKDSATSVQSKAAASKDKASVSLKSESAAVTTAPDASQSRTKGD